MSAMRATGMKALTGLSPWGSAPTLNGRLRRPAKPKLWMQP
jgi:hypothetical protein